MIAVDSPPGITRPSSSLSCSGLRTSTGSAPRRRSTAACSRKLPWTARMPILGASPMRSILVPAQSRPVFPSYTEQRHMRTEILQPLRHAPARPQRDAGRRISWRCGPADEVEPHLHGAAMPAGPATKRVLVVDDELSIRMLCRVNLIASGIEVLEAENGLDAVELVRREQPDLVLLDVTMPDLDGFEVARRL